MTEPMAPTADAAVEQMLAALREARKTARERGLERLLHAIFARHRDAMLAECAPIYEELAQIEARKPPMPIVQPLARDAVWVAPMDNPPNRA